MADEITVADVDDNVQDCTCCTKFLTCTKYAPKGKLPSDLTICEKFIDNFVEADDPDEVIDLLEDEDGEWDECQEPDPETDDDDILSDDPDDVR